MPDTFSFHDLTFPADGTVLDGVGVSIGERESVALFGPNGGGKTSVMRLIAGTVAGTKPLAVVSYLPQTPYLFRGTVELNLVLGLDDFEAADARVLAEDLEVAHVLSKPSGEISGGEAQRISLARTLASKAPLVLLDEPLAPINAAGRAEVAQIIRERTAERALLWATHSMEAVHAIADRIVVIDEGVVLQAGLVADVLDAPVDERVANILGTP